jgi:3-oxoacyl-[acyl-carrier protein] reductase
MSWTVVTGASRGLGCLLVKELISAGHHVIGIARTPTEKWSMQSSDYFIQYQCDLTDESMVKRTFSEIRKSGRSISCLVNNAGIFSSNLLQTSSSSHIKDVLNSNLLSTLLTTREVSKMMRLSDGGSVISISSISASIRMPGNAIYGLSKVAMEELMRGFATEFRGSGITFNSLRISFVESTGMVDSLNMEARKIYESRLLQHNAVSAQEIYHAIQFFDSSLARSITGQVLSLGSPD